MRAGVPPMTLLSSVLGDESYRQAICEQMKAMRFGELQLGGWRVCLRIHMSRLWCTVIAERVPAIYTLVQVAARLARVVGGEWWRTCLVVVCHCKRPRTVEIV